MRLLAGLLLLVAAFLAGRLLAHRQAASAERDASGRATSEARPAAARPRGASEQQIRASLENVSADLKNESAYEEVGRLLAEWMETDPPAALDYARQHLAGPRRTQAMMAILSGWTKTDPRAAWQWVGANAPRNGQYVDAVLSELGKTDANLTRSLADEFARQHPDLARSGYVSALRGILYAGSYQEASRLVAGANLDAAPGGREALTGLVASEWSRYEPAAAAEWARTLPAEAGREQALLGVGQSWAVADPPAAAGFATELPAGKMRQTVLTDAVVNWLQKDPADVARWIGQHERNADFDPALNQLAIQPAVVRENLPAALGWANAITDQELRTQTLTKIMGTWAERDPAAVDHYLRTAPDLPPALRDEVAARYRGGDLFGHGQPR